MKLITRTKDLNIISLEYSYEGYLWKSNSVKPEIYHGDKLSSHTVFEALPFIIEGHLYSEAAKVSYHIQNIEGQYWVTQYDFNQLENIICDSINYLGNSKIEYDYVMCEAWEEVELVTGVKTLEPSWSAFQGFTK